jgi:hypothetical protein
VLLGAGRARECADWLSRLRLSSGFWQAGLLAIGKGQIEAVDLTEAGLIRAGCLIQFPDTDVTKRRFRRLAGMHLYGNDAAAGGLGSLSG